MPDMSARIIEFKPSPTDVPKKADSVISLPKSKTIPLGLSELELMGDTETNEIIRKFTEFVKLKPRFNREICNRYK